MCTLPGALRCRSVNLLDLLDHVVNLLLPGLITGSFAAALAKLLWRRDLAAVSYRWLASCAALASMAINMAGLVAFGSDGRMLTYVCMVAGCAVALAWGGWARRRNPS